MLMTIRFSLRNGAKQDPVAVLTAMRILPLNFVQAILIGFAILVLSFGSSRDDS